jgi:hypothetical protein
MLATTPHSLSRTNFIKINPNPKIRYTDFHEIQISDSLDLIIIDIAVSTKNRPNLPIRIPEFLKDFYFEKLHSLIDLVMAFIAHVDNPVIIPKNHSLKDMMRIEDIVSRAYGTCSVLEELSASICMFLSVRQENTAISSCKKSMNYLKYSPKE